jgi:hypothetical protein
MADKGYMFFLLGGKKNDNISNSNMWNYNGNGYI